MLGSREPKRLIDLTLSGVNPKDLALYVANWNVNEQAYTPGHPGQRTGQATEVSAEAITAARSTVKVLNFAMNNLSDDEVVAVGKMLKRGSIWAVKSPFKGIARLFKSARRHVNNGDLDKAQKDLNKAQKITQRSGFVTLS